MGEAEAGPGKHNIRLRQNRNMNDPSSRTDKEPNPKFFFISFLPFYCEAKKRSR